jgi:hypothetical protein
VLEEEEEEEEEERVTSSVVPFILNTFEFEIIALQVASVR